MNRLLEHRGPDGEGLWTHPAGHVGFAHRRLEIIDLATGDQPMRDEGGNWITYNGEIYNYLELRQELGEDRVPHDVRHRSRPPRVPQLGPGVRRPAARDVRLRALGRGGRTASSARATASASSRSTTRSSTGRSICASEAKALLPFLPAIETDLDALKDYLAFQFCLAGKTLFRASTSCSPGTR